MSARWVGAALLFVLGLAYLASYFDVLDACDARGGVLVRGALWYECVEGKP